MPTALKVGDTLPGDTTFTYVPYPPDHGEITSSRITISYNAKR